MIIQITRKEQHLLQKINAVMAANQSQSITDEQLWELDPDNGTGEELIEKEVLLFDPNSEEKAYTITKEQLQIVDDDPEVEKAWENFRAVQGDGRMSKLYERNLKAEKAAKKLEQVLFKKGRLTHMINSDSVHIWVTEDKIQYWKDRKFKEVSPAAVPAGL